MMYRYNVVSRVPVTSPLGDVGLWGEFEGGWKNSISLARRRFLLGKRLNVVSEFFRLSAYLTAIINRKIELGVRVSASPYTSLPVRICSTPISISSKCPQRKLATCCLARGGRLLPPSGAWMFRNV
jgi:hypothetical protein